MPHFGIHLITLRNTIDKLLEIDEDRFSFLQNERNLTAAQWGALGPDLFFVSFYENPELRAIQNSLYLAYRTLEPFKEIYEILEPLQDDYDELENFFTGGLTEAAEETIDRIKGLLHTVLLGIMATNVDAAAWFEMRLAYGRPESEWYWFDLLHHRNTGLFAQNLLVKAQEATNSAEEIEMLEAYVIGYLTHIATDVVGHPYVNTFCGGPYRTQWHRHLLGENIMDTWAWNMYQPGIGTVVEFEPEFGGGIQYALSELHQVMELDDSQFERIARLLSEALGESFDANEYPEMLTVTELESLFRYYLELLKLQTSQGRTSPPPPEEPQVFPAIDNLLEDAPVMPAEGDPDADWNDIFTAIVARISWSIETVIELLHLPQALAADIATFPVRYWLYTIRLLIWDLHEMARLLLVRQGYIIPFWDEIFDADFTDFRLLGQYSADCPHPYPHKRNAPIWPDENGNPGPIFFPTPVPPGDHHLAYPDTPTEAPETIVSLYRENDFPSVFIESTDDNLTDISEMVRRYIGCRRPFQPQVPEPDATYTEELNKELCASSNRTPLGGAPDLGAILVAKAFRLGRNVADLSPLDNLAMADIDFNLDGDRGFGWKCWPANIAGFDPDQINIETYLQGGY
ncbi:MAG: hypothetical protein BroJett011_77660 [Chloroflexota bacterium]|nr:MAG: hypothetical protein BroJett011_77660 [Chloroflexota bacterium]